MLNLWQGIEKPTVGLLNNGTEENKGNDLTKRAFKLLKDETNDSFYWKCRSPRYFKWRKLMLLSQMVLQEMQF